MANDDIRHNAGVAVWRLRRIGAAAWPELEAALHSADGQQRQLAAWTLRAAKAPATPMLCAVSVDALHRDFDHEVNSVVRDEVSKTPHAARWLAKHSTRARPFLVRGLSSAQGQQRFLCAYLLAQGGHHDYVREVCCELALHLNDNRVEGDAMMAAHGLFRLGAAALPSIREARRIADAQAHAVLDLLEWNLREPPRNAAELRLRLGKTRLTTLYHDPSIEFDIERSQVPTFRD